MRDDGLTSWCQRAERWERLIMDAMLSTLFSASRVNSSTNQRICQDLWEETLYIYQSIKYQTSVALVDEVMLNLLILVCWWCQTSRNPDEMKTLDVIALNTYFWYSRRLARWNFELASFLQMGVNSQNECRRWQRSQKTNSHCRNKCTCNILICDGPFNFSGVTGYLPAFNAILEHPGIWSPQFM